MTMIVRALIEAVGNGVLWGVALTAMVAWLIRLLDRTNAGTRFAIWCLTLAAVVLLPVLILQNHFPDLAAGLPLYDGIRVLLAFWICGAFLMLGRLLWSVLYVRRLRKRAELLPLAADVPIYSSTAITSPMAVGVRAPVILVPDGLLPALSDPEREHIILHELAHIRRADHSTNLAQKLAEAIFFFHPGVWWIGRRMRIEREIACDDWVVAGTGAPQPYAATLTRLLEWKASMRAPWLRFPRFPVLATAAVSSRPQISRRIEMLLDRTRNRNPRPAIAAVCAALLFLLMAVVWCAHQPALFAFSNPRDAGHRHISYSNFWGSFTLTTYGAVEFAANDQDVSRISPGGSLVIEERQGLMWRKLSFTSKDGRVERAFYLNGVAHPYGPEGREWAAGILPRVIRETGIGAPARVARILHQGGPPAVLAEISRIESDGSKRVYFEELIAQSSDPDVFGRVVRQATHEIGSDGERRVLLSGLLRRRPVHGPMLAELLQAVARIGSDGEKAQFLTQAVRSYSEDESSRAAFFKAVNTIGSDGERRRVLSELLKRPLAKPDLVRVFDSSAKIGSDGEKASLLAQGAGEVPADPSVRRAWFGAVDTIGSDGEHLRALQALLRDNGHDRDTLVAIVRSAAKMGSDGEKASLLAKVADKCPDDDAILSPLIETAQTLHSEKEYRRVIESLIRRGHTIRIIKKI